MRTLLAVLLALVALAPCPAAQEAAPKGQKLIVKGLKDDAGLLLVAFYVDKGTWLGKKALLGMDVPVKRDAAGEMVITIPGKLPEKVAIAIIHDRNGNHDMDRNRLGIPLEAYGFSNGVRPRFGPPDFDAALVRTGEPISVTVDTLL